MNTYIRVVPFAHPCLELSQAEMNLNTEDGLPVCLSAKTGHGFGAGLQRGQISPHETQGREIV
jgi:hypothetical protein